MRGDRSAIRDTRAGRAPTGMRILVIEDEPEFANLIAEGLRDQGMAVDVAYDGLSGASKINLNPYDVVVLDRDLPGMHGDTLCRVITDSDDPAMILMVTAAGTPAERVAGLALGADDYLPKPFHFPELVLRIRALARRKPAAQERTLAVAGIELDPLAHIASRDRPTTGAVRERVRGARSAAQGQPGSAERRAPSRAGLGRERRSVHQHRSRDDRSLETQARYTQRHPEHAGDRISGHRERRPLLTVTPRVPKPRRPSRRPSDTLCRCRRRPMACWWRHCAVMAGRCVFEEGRRCFPRVTSPSGCSSLNAAR